MERSTAEAHPGLGRKHAPLRVPRDRRTVGQRNDRESLAERYGIEAAMWLIFRRVARAGNYDIMVVKTGHDWAALSRDIPVLSQLDELYRGKLYSSRKCSEPAPDSCHRSFKTASRLLVGIWRRCHGLVHRRGEEWKRFCGSCDIHVVANPLLQVP